VAVAIEVQSLCFGVNGKPILQNVDFTVEAGEIVVIIGENGAGKTTLLDCLISHHLPDKGEIRLFGNLLAEMSVEQRAATLAMLRQEQLDTFPYCVSDVVMMGRVRHISLFSTPSEEDVSAVNQMLEYIGIASLAGRNFNTLSRGEKQLVLLARAFVQEATVLLLDEPTNHLDFANQYRFLDAIRQVSRELNKTVIAVMHDPNQAARLADKVLLLQRGERLAYGPPDQVLTEKQIKQLYGLDVRFIRWEERVLLGVI
jgi:iron complex transport system ATP-binding protein